MARPVIALGLIALMTAPVFAAGNTDTTRERVAKDALSDLVNSDRAIKPIYTDPDEVTSKTLLELLHDASQEPLSDDQWMQDPFTHIQKDMKLVTGQLERQRSGQPVQDKQTEIVRKLDVLIEQLEQAQKNMQSACNGGGAQPGGGQANSPMQDSMLTGGPGGQGELRDPDSARKRWADLPDKDREKVLQSRTEGFPAGYEELLEEYYRRLAETEAADTSPASTSGSNTE